MPRLRLVHAADLHLDTPFSGISAAAPQVRDALVEASLDAWETLVQLALDETADALLIAGDLYDGAERGIRAQLRLRAGLERLSQAGIQTFIVHGNHDPLSGWSAIRDWPAGVHVFAADEVSEVPLLHEGQPVAVVQGISYARRDTRDNLAARFHRSLFAGPQIGLLHANVGGSGEHDAWAPCSLSDLVISGLDYWALGHIHRRQIVRQGDPWVVYPGNLQGRSPKPAETGAKGAYVVELDTELGGFSTPRFVALDRIRFISHALTVSPTTDIGGLFTQLIEEVERLRGEHDGRALILRLELTGRADLGSQLRRPQALAEFVAEVQQALVTLTPFAWIERLTNSIGAEIDREAIRRRADFSAAVLEFAQGLAADPERLAAFVAERTGALKSGALAAELRGLPEPDAGDLLEEALAGVLDDLELQQTP